MNARTDTEIRSPTGLEELCAEFEIDDATTPFAFHNVMTEGEQYIFSFWIRSEASGTIVTGDLYVDTSETWEYHTVTFIADSDTFYISFLESGIYHIYHAQLEIGNKDTDWALNPADTEEEVETLKTSTTELKLTVDSITARVTEQEDKLTITETLATQTADKFEWLVKSGDSSSTFTITDRMAELISETISLNGNVKVSGDMLVDGSITAAKINTEDLFAQKLTATDLHITGESTFEGEVTATSLKAKDALVLYDQFGNEFTALSSMAEYAMAEGTLTLGSEEVSIINIVNPVRFYKKFSLFAGPRTVSISKNGILAYGSSDDINSDSEINISTADGTVNIKNVTKEAQYNAENDLRSGRFVVSSTGKIGLYDVTNSEWIIASDTDKQVTVHNRLVIPPEGTAANRPAGDNTYSCGHASYRYTEVYAVNGTIQTSDEREKYFLNDFDLYNFHEVFMSLEPKAFTWNTGNDRKIHLGIGAQSAERCMELYGYNSEEYSMVRRDILDEPSDMGLTDRYSMDYQFINMLTLMQCQVNTKQNEDLNNRIAYLEQVVSELIEENKNLKNKVEAS